MCSKGSRDCEKVLNHLAIIMDGNGRWAKQRKRPRIFGHRAGAKAVREAIEGCKETGIRYLTLYSFSTENWTRPPSEVQALMNLLRRYLKSEITELHAQNIRLRVIGDRTPLDKDILALIEDAETLTQANTSLQVILALNYGGRQELATAAAQLAVAVSKGELTLTDITPEKITQALQTRDIPDPDVILRTSGEQRLSNFLLWQSAYSELIFIKTLWPDFNRQHIHDAVAEFQQRERRFGGIASPQ
ncbi:MAG: isoprenyl transferase [bacterium]